MDKDPYIIDHIYDSIRDGVMTREIFKAWVESIGDRAYNEGHENGYHDGLEDVRDK